MVLSRKFYFISVSVLLVLLTILAISNIDYSISERIINETSIWARFFDIFGELPAMFAVIIGITLLYGGRNREKQWWNIVSTILAVAFISIFSTMAWFNVVRYIFHEEVSNISTFAWIVTLILILVTISSSILIAHRKGYQFVDFKRHAWLLIILVVSEMVLVNIFKGVWARPRMRSIIDGENEFKYWYQISGWSNDNELKSFPSGHTANAWVSLAFVIFMPYLKKIKASYWIIGASVWGTLVALSRVVLGAHFLSDVLVGSYITILLFILLNHFFLKRGKNENEV